MEWVIFQEKEGSSHGRKRLEAPHGPHDAIVRVRAGAGKADLCQHPYCMNLLSGTELPHAVFFFLDEFLIFRAEFSHRAL